MMIIAHRGNLDGPNTAENRPDYIEKALQAEFLAEVDVWGKHPKQYGASVWLGHDAPHYAVDWKWIQKPGLFVHCKDVEALVICRALRVENYFYHNRDDVTLTSSKHIWTYPDEKIHLTPFSIPVLFTKQLLWKLDQISDCAGICTDYAYHHDAIFNHGA